MTEQEQLLALLDKKVLETRRSEEDHESVITFSNGLQLVLSDGDNGWYIV